MKKRHKRVLALMAAKKAGDLVLGRAAARNASKRGQPEPPRQCPYAKAAKMALAGAGVAAGTALGRRWSVPR